MYSWYTNSPGSNTTSVHMTLTMLCVLCIRIHTHICTCCLAKVAMDYYLHARKHACMCACMHVCMNACVHESMTPFRDGHSLPSGKETGSSKLTPCDRVI